MITIQANKLLSKNLDDEFLSNNIQKKELSFCKKHRTYNSSQCSFCNNNLEESFYYQTHQKIQIINGVIIDVNDKPLNNELYNAGISSYDQEINKQFIQTQLSQNKQPNEVAIQLKMYDEDDINTLINDKLQNIDTNGQQEIQLTIDLWEISQTKTYLERACDICEQLKLKNCYFALPGDKAYFIQFEQDDKDCMASKEISLKKLTIIKGEFLVIQDKKFTFPENIDGQCRRILNKAIETLQSEPFNGDLVFLTNERRDLLTFAQKFGKQNSAVHIYCKAEDIDYYYNSGGAAGINVNCLNAQNFEDWEYRIKVEATNNIIFLDSQTNNIELKLQKNEELQLEFEFTDDQEGFVQVIVLNQDGICRIQQKKVQQQEQLYQPSVYQKQLSEQTLKLTDYSKS